MSRQPDSLDLMRMVSKMTIVFKDGMEKLIQSTDQSSVAVRRRHAATQLLSTLSKDEIAKDLTEILINLNEACQAISRTVTPIGVELLDDALPAYLADHWAVQGDLRPSAIELQHFAALVGIYEARQDPAEPILPLGWDSSRFSSRTNREGHTIIYVEDPNGNTKEFFTITDAPLRAGECIAFALTKHYGDRKGFPNEDKAKSTKRSRGKKTASTKAVS